jgi:hypothetical protein
VVGVAVVVVVGVVVVVVGVVIVAVVVVRGAVFALLVMSMLSVRLFVELGLVRFMKLGLTTIKTASRERV